MGIIQVATVRRDLAHLWELVAPKICGYAIQCWVQCHAVHPDS